MRWTAVALVAVAVACGGYSDNCPAGVGTPGTVQCANDTCQIPLSPTLTCCGGTHGGASRGGYMLRWLFCDDATDCPKGSLCCATSNKGDYPAYMSFCSSSWDACKTPGQEDLGAPFQLCLADCECHDNWRCVDGGCVR
jgi:hypothetical protein